MDCILKEPVITCKGFSSGRNEARINYSNGDRYIFKFSMDGDDVKVTYLNSSKMEAKSFHKKLSQLDCECLNSSSYETEEIPGVYKKIKYAKSELFGE